MGEGAVAGTAGAAGPDGVGGQAGMAGPDGVAVAQAGDVAGQFTDLPDSVELL